MTSLQLQTGCVQDDICYLGSISILADDAAMLGLRAEPVEQEILHFA